MKKRAVKVSGRYSEFDVFTNTMLVVVVVIGIAAEISFYSDASVEDALSVCADVRASIEDCMRSKGYVLTDGDRTDMRGSWESTWRHRMLVDL